MFDPLQSDKAGRACEIFFHIRKGEKMRCKHFGFVALFVGAMTLQARAALLTNPSFEQPVVNNPDFNYYYAGNPAITGWTIVGGSVDLLSTNWAAHEGNQSIDLSGVTPGGLYQDVSTTPGTS
jgi:hypothetical protein